MSRLRDPRIKRRGEGPIKRAQTEFLGMLTGAPAREIDSRHSALNVNLIDRGKYSEVRHGSRLYAEIPTHLHLLVEVPDYHTYGLDTAGVVVGKCVHEKAGVIVWVLYDNTYNDNAGGSEVWISSLDMTTWESAKWLIGNSLYLKPRISDPTKLTMVVEGDDVIIASEEEGIFRVALGVVEHESHIYFVYKINLSLNFAQVSNVNFNEGVLDYGYRLFISLVKNSIPGNRILDGNRIEWESGVGGVDIENDYSERYYATPIADDGVDRSFPVVVTTEWKHPTHYGFYRTKDIGPNGINATITGLGNNPNLAVWEEDVRIAVVAACRVPEAGVILHVILGYFTNYEIGCTLHIHNRTTGAYVSSRTIVSQSSIDWRTVPIGIDGPTVDICWAPGLNLFVSLSTNAVNKVIVSDDGVTWTGVAVPQANTWSGICFKDTSDGVGVMFVAVSIDGVNRVMTSPDGTAWTNRVAAEANEWIDVAWGDDSSFGANGLFCAVARSGANRVMTSSDGGVTWVAHAAAEANTWEAICWSPLLGIFVAVASDGVNRIMTSEDGAVWTARYVSELSQWADVCWSPELELFCAVSSNNAIVIISPDGISWTPHNTINDGLNGRYEGVTWSPELKIFCAVMGPPGTGGAGYSSDGINWKLQNLPFPFMGIYGAVAWSPYLGIFAAAYNGGNSIATLAKEVVVDGADIAAGLYDVFLGMPDGQNLIRGYMHTTPYLLDMDAAGTNKGYGAISTASVYEGSLILRPNGERLLVDRMNDSGDDTYFFTKQDIDFDTSEPLLVLKSGTYMRKINPIVIDDPDGTGVVALQDRVDSGSELYIPRRYFKNVPDCGIASIDSGWGLFANRQDMNIYFSQCGDKPYSLGYYCPGIQNRKLNGPIQGMVQSPSVTVVLLRNQTILISLANATNVGRADSGESIFQLQEPIVSDDKIGVVAWWSVKFVGNRFIAITNEPAVRYFNGNAWGSENYAIDPATGDDAVMKSFISKILLGSGGVSSYSLAGGYKVWFYKMEGGAAVRAVLRFATQMIEGIGWSQYGGKDFVDPVDYIGDLDLKDENGIPRSVVITHSDEHGIVVFESDTCDRVNFLIPPATDKQVLAGTGGTEIAWEKHGREETVSYDSENKKMRHDVSHVFVDPSDPANRGETGYTASGFRNALEVSLEAYIDGEKTTPAAATEDIPEDGDIVFVGTKVEGRKIQMVVKGTAGEVFINGRSDEFIASDKVGSRTERTMAESTLSASISTDIEYWVTRNLARPTYEKIRQSSISMAVTQITGPDGRASSAITSAAAINLGTPAVGGDYTIILWANVAAPIVGFVMTDSYTHIGTWRLLYNSGAAGIGANIIKAAAAGVFDIRVYSKQLSAAEREYLYNDIARNQGKGTIGW